jgi:signal transduction histidine kinase/ActR/RegA family two-component response regulator
MNAGEPQQELTAAEPAVSPPAADLGWGRLPRAAQFYVAIVIAMGVLSFVSFFPRTFPQPLLFIALLLWACLTSTWKVNLPIPLASGSTLSVSYAANLMALLLLGAEQAMLIAVAGAWTQCTYKVKQRYPTYRTVFSMAGEACTIAATGLAYVWLGGSALPIELSTLAKPLVGAISIYFVVNTMLVAGAIAFSTRQRVLKVWGDEFLWSGVTFMVAGGAGALAAYVIDRGEHWKAILLIAPVYLTYRTYELFVGRLEDQKQHVAEISRLHQKTVEALTQARQAETALAAEKERLAATLADMTRLEEARVHLLEREQAARASAEQANRLKDQFLAVVSHELRTPLTSMLGWADMLRRGQLAEGKRERAYETIFNSASRQSQLIDDLLDVSRIMSGRLRLQRTPVVLNDVLRSALQVVQPIADAKQVNLIVSAATEIQPLYGDAARLQQVAWNLLSNAISFTPPDGTVRVQLRHVNGAAEMIVTDTGQGIPADFLPSVFEPFRQADASTTRPHGGLGLGLSIVKHLVEAHGGTVSAHSPGEGCGATFTVRLPLRAGVLPPPEVAGDRAVETDWTTEQGTLLEGMHVLIVDDDDATRQVVAAQLESHRATTSSAASAAQAFDMLQHEHFDVLLADIAMPGEDGYTLIRKVRASAGATAASIPAAALTAFARDEDRQQALRAGFQLHLAKPIDARSLIAAVATLGRSNPRAFA